MSVLPLKWMYASLTSLFQVTFHDSKTLEIRRAYYACVSFADQQIGRVSVTWPVTTFGHTTLAQIPQFQNAQPIVRTNPFFKPKVLRELNELGLAENTVVMFVGDHGLQVFHCGKANVNFDCSSWESTLSGTSRLTLRSRTGRHSWSKCLEWRLR